MKKIYIIGIIAGTAAIISAAGYFMYQSLVTNIANNAATRYEASQQLHAQSIANDTENYFKDIEKRLEIMAHFPIVKQAQRGEACNLALQQLVEVNNEVFSNLGRVDKNGNFACSVNRSVVGEPASKYGTYFQQVKDNPKHDPVMSRLIYPTGSSTQVVAVHVPVYDDKGNFDGTLGGAVYFKNIEDKLIREEKISQSSFIVIHDDNGDILYHPDPLIQGRNALDEDMMAMFTPKATMENFFEKVKQGNQSGRLAYALRGEERVGRYESANVIDRYWTILVAVPKKDQLKIVEDKNIKDNIAITIAILCFVIFLSILAVLKANMSRKHARK